MSENEKTGQSATEEVSKFKVVDGMASIPVDKLNAYVSDMFKYKGQRNDITLKAEQLEKQIAEFSQKEKQIEEAKLIEQNKFKELADAREREIVEMKSKFNQQKIDLELTGASLKAGAIDSADVIRLIDHSQIKIEENGNVSGVAEAIENLKKSKAYLFGIGQGAPKPEVDTGKSGKLPDTLTWKTLMADPVLADRVAKEKPELYQRLKQSKN